MNKYSLRPRVEGSGTKGSLDNGDIIAIVGIFASIIATLFSVWLLDMLHKRYGGSIGAVSTLRLLTIFIKFNWCINVYITAV